MMKKYKALLLHGCHNRGTPHRRPGWTASLHDVTSVSNEKLSMLKNKVPLTLSLFTACYFC